jgi:hypothetical protein
LKAENTWHDLVVSRGNSEQSCWCPFPEDVHM